MRLRDRLADRRPDLRDDRGTTLMELVVGMLVGLIFLSMFTGAIVILYQTSNRANALTASAGQTGNAFARLDKSIRYAASISQPGTTSTGWYVEYLTNALTPGGAATCTQLQVTVPTATTPGQLSARTWTVSGSTIGAATSFVPWASGITNGNAAATAGSPTAPFVLQTSDPTVAYEQLTVNLTATSGSPPVPAQTNATYTAINSSAAEASTRLDSTFPASVCQRPEGRP